MCLLFVTCQELLLKCVVNHSITLIVLMLELKLKMNLQKKRIE